MAGIQLPDGVTLSVERTPYGEMEARMPPSPHHVLAIHLSGRCVLEWMPDARMNLRRPARGDVTLVPAGQEGLLRGRRRTGEVLKVGMPAAILAAVARESAARPSSPALRERLAVADPLAQQIGLALLRESERPGTVDTLYRDALSGALVAHLLRRHGEGPAAPGGPRRVHPLSEGRARRALAYLEASLTRPVGIAEVARELGLSASHFTAQFRETFGRSPARYLTWMRLERARTMLAAGRLDIGEIVAAVGFASGSHFAQAFKATFGLAPSRYRRGPGRASG